MRKKDTKDKGERYEVRAVLLNGREQCIGWTDSLDIAKRVVDVICTNPVHAAKVKEAFVIDRFEKSESLICLTCRGKLPACLVCGGSGVIETRGH